MAAKLTQLIYGTSSHAAGLLIEAKEKKVARIAIQRIIISTTAHPGSSSLKKIKDQKKFNTSCTTNKKSALFFLPELFFAFHTKNKATPIIMYSAVQTGANTQPGGFHIGFSSV